MGKLLDRLLLGKEKAEKREAKRKLDSETYGTKEWEDRQVKEAYKGSEFKGRVERARERGYAHGVNIEDTGGSGLIGKLTRTAINLNGGLPLGTSQQQGGGGGGKRSKKKHKNQQPQQVPANNGGNMFGLGATMDFGAMAQQGSGLGIGAFNMDGAFGGGGGPQKHQRRRRRHRGR